MDSLEIPEQALTPTPQQARSALDEAGEARLVSRADVRALTIFVAGVGLIVGALLYLSWLTLSGGNVVGFVVSMSSYAVALALLFIVKARAQSLPRGFGRAYNAGFVTTMTLYASCIAWVFGHQDPWPSATVVVILSAVVALPCLVAATVVHRLGRR
jgi:peptidoglycan biosynthesis protein MviN/MurJ (putative lipid II flippase)